jgi:hypothetical protein
MEYLEGLESLDICTASRDHEKVTLGAPLARHINLPVPPLLLAAFAICGDKSMSGDSVTKTTRERCLNTSCPQWNKYHSFHVVEHSFITPSCSLPHTTPTKGKPHLSWCDAEQSCEGKFISTQDMRQRMSSAYV